MSPILPKPASGLIIASDFESKTHDELCAMVEHADVERTALMAARLASAAALITLLGDELKGHVAQVQWEGEAGEAFRTWGADMANATLRLGELSGTAGQWMAHAASTLSEVKSAMPKPSAAAQSTLDAYRRTPSDQVGKYTSPLVSDQSGGLHHPQSSGPTQRQAYDAQLRLDRDRAEAAQQMRKLAESYAWSAHQMSVAPRPTFRPMPDAWMPPPKVGVEHLRRMGPAAGTTAPAGLGTGAPSGHASASPIPSPGIPAGGVGRPFQPVALSPTADIPDQARSRVDSVTPKLPPHYPSAGEASSLPPGGGMADGSRPTDHVVVPPPTTDFGGKRTDPNSVDRGARGAQNRVFPIQERGHVRPPLPVSRMGTPNDGVVGGRPSPTPKGSEPGGGRMPRGTVIGTEQSQANQSRSPMTYGPGAVPAGSGAAATPRGGGGRRLATEPGGVVGGRPQSRAGATGSPFTPGGAGLVRDPSASGQSKRNRRDRRPDYLVEDQTSWAEGHRRVVPPVID
ncbi:hypothetical protein GCM10018779_37440 [Streptomyces griseocarneus]|nr:hypothetical protein GCM10018779_37440 [Streptomyces griseocarneus]